jgi:hypothetical protein
MNRDCSWWNEKATMDAAYVLEHEQIHFALTELGARSLSANAAQIAGELERVDSLDSLGVTLFVSADGAGKPGTPRSARR